MVKQPKIILVGDLPGSNWCDAFFLLEQLHDAGLIECVAFPSRQRIPAGRIQANAIICRPSRSGHLTISTLDRPNEPLLIATLSKGTDHINLPSDYVKQVFSARGDANAPAVADHTVNMASQVLRPADQAATEMAQRGWNIKMDSKVHQFDEFEWGCIGSGAQVRYLLPQLVSRRCHKIRIFHPDMNKERFLGVVSYFINTQSGSTLVNDMEISCINPTGRETIISGTNNDEDVFSSSDIVSLHVPAVGPDKSKYNYNTIELINKDTISKMKRGIYLINPSRGALVNERDVVTALHCGHISGIASDVVCPQAEHHEDPQYSPLWQEYCKVEDERGEGELRKFTIYLTPHIGGFTVEAINGIAWDVIMRLLQSLNVPLPFNENHVQSKSIKR